MPLTSVPCRLLSLAVASSLVTTMPVEAQVAGQAGGSVVGIVVDEASHPLANVSVSVDSTQQTTQTDANGAFRLNGLAHGTYVLRLRLIGYNPARQAVAVSGEPLRVRIQMTTLPRTLEEVRISRRRARLPGVYAREAQGFGAVLYAEDIPRYQQSRTTDLLRFAPKLAGQLSGVGSCARVAYFIDGRPLPNGWTVDEYVRLEDIEAIEAHRSADFLKDSRLVQEYTPVGDRVEQGFGAVRFGTPGTAMGLLSGTCARIVMVWTRHYRPSGD